MRKIFRLSIEGMELWHHLCGTDKVKVEWGLLAIAHNITSHHFKVLPFKYLTYLKMPEYRGGQRQW